MQWVQGSSPWRCTKDFTAFLYTHRRLWEQRSQLTLNLPFGSVVFSIYACRTNPLYHLRIGKIPPAVVCKGPGFESLEVHQKLNAYFIYYPQMLVGTKVATGSERATVQLD